MGLGKDQLVDLAQHLVKEAERRGAALRLLGGLAFYLTSPEAAEIPGLARDYGDLDFVVDAKGARALPEVFASQGWEADRQFNALHGQTRLLYYYQEALQADVFIGSFVQCHRLDLERDLRLTSPTLPLADLLLTKLQIHRLNAKDLQDAYTLLAAHPVAEGGDPGQIDLGMITRLTSGDWGWYTTIHDNLQVLEEGLPARLNGDRGQMVRQRLEDIRRAIETAPKSLKWQLRDKIGRRVPWYDEPEEVHR